MALSRAARQYLGVRAVLPPDLQTAARAPTSADTAYVKGTLWLDTAADSVYMWPGSGSWIALGSGGAGAVITLTGNSGGAISPVAGNIDIVGGTGVTVTGTAGTLTIDLTGGGIAMDSFVPDAGTNPVVPTGLGAVTMAGTANQITTTGGLNTLTFSIPAVFIAPGSIQSTTSLTVGTNTTATGGNASFGGGTFTVATGVNAINISADASATTVNLATGAAVKTLTLGSTTGASITTLQSGSGGMSINSNGGALAILSGTGAMSISADAAATTLNIGTGAAAKAVTLGSSNTTSATTILAGSGGINIDGVTLINDSVNSNTSINTGTSTGTVTIGNALAGAINVDTGAGISLDAVTASNFTVTGAADLTLASTAGSVIVSSGEAVANAIQLTASDAAGGIAAAVGTGHFNLTGNLNFTAAGNKILSASVGSGATAGANSFGSATLTGGTVTVATTAVTASSLIYLTRMSVGATGANDLGILSVGAIVAGTSFEINAWTVTNATALQADDVSVIGWMIVN